MKLFTDNAGRAWTVVINVDAIKRVKSLLGVNLLDIVDGKLLEQLVTDPLLLCDVIYCVCKPEADSRNVSQDEFDRAMSGDAIDGAQAALLQELVDFFPQATRQVLTKALTKLKAFQAKAIELASKRLDDPTLDAEMMNQLETNQSQATTFGD